MSITHNIGATFSGAGSNTISGSVSTSSTDEANLSLPLLANQNATAQAYAVPSNTLAPKSIFIMATCDVTIQFFAAATPKTTFVLKANTPVIWATGAGTCPLATDADMTQIKYTTAAGITGTLECRILLG